MLGVEESAVSAVSSGEINVVQNPKRTICKSHAATQVQPETQTLPYYK